MWPDNLGQESMLQNRVRSLLPVGKNRTQPSPVRDMPTLCEYLEQSTGSGPTITDCPRQQRHRIDVGSTRRYIQHGIVVADAGWSKMLHRSRFKVLAPMHDDAAPCPNLAIMGRHDVDGIVTLIAEARAFNDAQSRVVGQGNVAELRVTGDEGECGPRTLVPTGRSGVVHVHAGMDGRKLASS